MARSSYVYVVLHEGKPLSGFTVKHEMVTWLRGRGDLDALTIFRIPDGGRMWQPAPSQMTVASLLEAGK